MVNGLRKFLKERVRDVYMSAIAAGLFTAPMIGDYVLEQRAEKSFVGRIEVNSNNVEIVKTRGFLNNHYRFFNGTNCVAYVTSWNGTPGKFELDGKVVSFDKWSGPYIISDKPQSKSVELKR